MALTVGIDGDDTLWHTERIFAMTQQRFSAMLAPFVSAADLDASLLATERRNLEVLGYGVKSFVLSMIETAIEVSRGAVSTEVIGDLLDVGKQMLVHPVELLEGVADTVPALAARWPLVLITKGDLFHQESKIARSGLLPHFTHVEIVSEKDPDVYRRILDRAGVPVDEFVMVGDSMRSDIAATLAIGARAIHIPGYREWALEVADVPMAADRWWRLESFAALPTLLADLDARSAQSDG